jgi:hypothetical protein
VENLLNDLNASTVDQAELSIVLLEYFTRSTQIEERRVVYMREEGQEALSLCYNRNERLFAIKPGAHLQEGDIQRLRQEIANALITPGPTQYGRAIMFSHVPVTGYFRWQDKLQILPVPENAPRPRNHWSGDHPFLLEISFPGSAHQSVTSQRREKHLREMGLLLAPLFLPGIRLQSNEMHEAWVYDTEEPGLMSVHRQARYQYEGFNGAPEAFTDTRGLRQLTSIDYLDYYSREGIGIDDTLEIPTTLSESLRRLDRINSEDRNRYLRASYWLSYSRKVWRLSKSAAFTALISAVEALFPAPALAAPCPSCGHNTNPGPTAQFQELLELLLPGSSISPKLKNELYRIRSKLAHGDRLFYQDQIGFGFHPTSNNEMNRLRHLTNVVQVAIYNWLQTRPI